MFFQPQKKPDRIFSLEEITNLKKTSHQILERGKTEFSEKEAEELTTNLRKLNRYALKQIVSANIYLLSKLCAEVYAEKFNEVRMKTR
jgi:flagellin-specific chaperone FliS